MSETQSHVPGYQRFFAELKRRRVFRVMAVYGATGFVVLQVADLLAEGLALPDVVLRTATFLVLVGFPIAVVLAWAFEVTPEGVKKTEDAAPGELTQIIEAPKSARWPAGLLALAGIAALVWGSWYVGKRAGESSATVAPPSAATATRARAGAGTGTSGPSGAVRPAAFPSDVDDGRQTIAVLPFDNMSGGAETEPFVVGVHDDLLTQLSKINALKVTSRTSVKEYRDTEKSIPEIAAELGVETVLEGGVQRAGDQVRINVQLIDPSTDEHLWAETYDAELTAENVFAIQSQIARSVADALEAELSPGERQELEVVATRNLDALAAYHAGKAEFDARGATRNDSLAVRRFEQAVALDPEFADAWAGLSMAISWQSQLRPNADLERSREAIAKAEALASGSASVEMARGYDAYYADGDFDRALGHFQAANALRPSDAEVQAAMGYILRRQGDWEGSIRHMWRALELDPRNVGLYWPQAENMVYLRRWRTAEALVERALTIDPRNTTLIGRKLEFLVIGDRNTARANGYAAELSTGGLPDDVVLATSRADLAVLNGADEEALRILGSAEPRSGFDRLLLAFSRGTIHLRTGDFAASRDDGAEIERLADEYLGSSAQLRASSLAIARALKADTAGTREMARETRRLAEASGDHVIGPRSHLSAAFALGLVGDTEEMADIILEQMAIPSPGLSVATLQLSPNYEMLRATPDFPAVLAAVEAAEAEGARRDEEAGY